MRALATVGDATLKIPLNIAIDTDGTFYIADSGREQVVVLDKDEKFVTALGKTGEMKPRDVAVGKDSFYVADLLGRSVRVYDKKENTLQFTIPRPEDRTNDDRRLYTPTNLALDSKGQIYVSDTGASCVMVYAPDGKFVRRVGMMGDSLGQFARIKGIAVDRADRLYAVDALSQVVQVFDPTGELLMWFAEPDTGNKMQDLPAKVFVDYDDVGFFEQYASPKFKVDHLVVMINQIGPRKVSIFGFGHKK
jgi:DNA-binding beta-propeller fold protein YncE